MTLLAIVVVALGVLIAWLIAQTPRRTLLLLQREETRRLRTERLTGLYANLSELTEISRRAFEEAALHPDQLLDPNQVAVLSATRDACQIALPGLEADSPILDRYYKNHVALIAYVLRETSGDASQAEIIDNALDLIYRFQAVEHSDEPIAVMEKKLATGQDP